MDARFFNSNSTVIRLALGAVFAWPAVASEQSSSIPDSAPITESRKVAGRIFITFVPGELMRDGGISYVVDPSLKGRRVEDIPCDDHPNPSVCE